MAVYGQETSQCRSTRATSKRRLRGRIRPGLAPLCVMMAAIQLAPHEANCDHHRPPQGLSGPPQSSLESVEWWRFLYRPETTKQGRAGSGHQQPSDRLGPIRQAHAPAGNNQFVPVGACSTNRKSRGSNRAEASVARRRGALQARLVRGLRRGVMVVEAADIGMTPSQGLIRGHLAGRRGSLGGPNCRQSTQTRCTTQQGPPMLGLPGLA